jgi:hypothetical protein
MADDAETIDDIILGPPIVGRACGDCVACCKFPEIDRPELKKQAGVLCQHCSGVQCKIYDARPSVCEKYFCVWRRVSALPDHLRPDKINIMFDLVRRKPADSLLTRLYIIGLAYNGWEEFDTPEAQEALAVFRRARLPVWLQAGDEMRLAHPSTEIANIVLHGAKPANPRAAAEAKAWIEMHEKF